MYRVVAVIAEALAVEVLPPESPAKQRIISIVKQIQVTYLGFFLLFYTIHLNYCTVINEIL